MLEVLEKSKDLEPQHVLQKSRELETKLCNDLKTCYPEKINGFTNILNFVFGSKRNGIKLVK